MSSHSLKAKRRHLSPTFGREAFQVGPVTFELIKHPEYGSTFAVIAGDVSHAAHRRPLFTGHVPRGMGTQLRKLAHRIDELAGDTHPRKG